MTAKQRIKKSEVMNIISGVKSSGLNISSIVHHSDGTISYNIQNESSIENDSLPDWIDV